MPLYDFECSHCGTRSEVMVPLAKFAESIVSCCTTCNRSRKHDLVVVPPAVEDWGNCSRGRWFEHLGPVGMWFRDKASYKAHLKREGLQEWAPKRGMPGQEV